MSWTLGGTRIYVRGFDEGRKQIIARLQPLNATTILHIFGNESPILQLMGTVATTADKDALEAMTTTQNSYALVGPEGSLGNWYASNWKSKRLPIECFSLFDRPTLSGTEPLYEVSMELFIDA